MKLKVILFILVLIAFYPISLHAFAEETSLKSASFPPDLIFRGKPIDPSCFFSPFVKSDGASWEIQDKCAEPEHDGAQLMLGSVTTKPDGSIGYSRITDEGRTVEFFYKYLGTTNEGFLIQTNWSYGGTGNWGFVELYKRKLDRLVFIKEVFGGDGAGSIKYENGSLYHSYFMTAADLFEKYMKNGTYREALDNGFGGCRRCTAAEVLVKDGNIDSLEIWDRDPLMPDCFKKTFLEAFSTKDALSENEMREVFSRFYSLCPLKK